MDEMVKTMARSKYIWLFVGFAISIAAFMTFVVLAELQKPIGSKKFIPMEFVPYFVNLLPGTLFTDLIFLYAIPIGMILLFIVAGVPMVMGLVKIHGLAHRGAKFGINPLGPKVSGAKLFRRVLFVGLFAFSLTVLIVNAGYGTLFRNISMSPPIVADTVLTQGEGVFIGTFFIVGFLIILLLPFWLMEDAGILIYDVRPENRVTPNISGVHLWYVDFFEGYAGISAIISLVTLIYGAFGEVSGLDPALLTPIMLVFLPFITSGLLTIPMVIYEKTLPKLVEKLQKKLDATKYPEVKVPLQDQVKVVGR